MYKIDLLRQIEANTRGGAVSDCYSKYDLWRMIERNTRSKPALIKKWTPNYTGQGYVEIPEWHGVAGDVVEFEFTQTRNGGNQKILDNYNVNRFYFILVNGVLVKSSNYTVTINDVIIDAGYKFDVDVKYRCKCEISLSSRIGFISSSFLGSENFNGSIKNIKLTKADGSDNRFYESVIEGETQPETLVLKDNISGKDGKMINFPTGEAWTDTYNLANGTWDMSHRELVKFSRSTKAWLDGVEYAPNEPRHTADGELLIEGQATNYGAFGLPTAYSTATKLIANNIIEAKFYTSSSYSSVTRLGIKFEGSAIVTFEYESDLDVPLVIYQPGLAYVTLPSMSGKVAFEYNGGGDMWFGRADNTINAVATVKIKNLMVTDIKFKDSTPIEISTQPATAVTRTADIATVRDTQ